MRTFISNFKKLPWAFIFSLILILGFQGLLAKNKAFWQILYRYSELSRDDPLRAEAKLRLMEDEESVRKVFLIGSSQTRDGIDTGSLNNHYSPYHLKFYNLGVAGSGQPIDLFAIKNRVLAKKPDVIVYMPFVESFYYEHQSWVQSNLRYYFNPELWGYMLQYLNAKENFSHSKAFFESLLSEATFLFKFRRSLAGILSNGLRAHLSDEPFHFKVYEEFEDKDVPYYTEQIDYHKNNDKYYYSNHTDLNKKLFTEIIKEFKDNGIEIIILNGPTHPVFFPRIYQPETEEAYLAFMSRQAEELGFTYITNDRRPVFNENEFMDMTHLNAEGRKKFTEFLIEYFHSDVVDKMAHSN